MECCYPDDCGEYTVTPVLVAPAFTTKYCEDESICYPCLPRCHKIAPMYCCEKKLPKSANRFERDDPEPYYHHVRDCPTPRQRECTSPPARQPTLHCPTCCQPTCKPVKTKYVMPCYRYEDGRIQNQPSILMRRACEVAVGTRARRKPFVCSSYHVDPEHEVRRYHSEDERGNCCYHFERKKPASDTCCYGGHTSPSHLRHGRRAGQPCTSSPQCHFVDCIHAKAIGPPKTCCYYC